MALRFTHPLKLKLAWYGSTVEPWEIRVGPAGHGDSEGWRELEPVDIVAVEHEMCNRTRREVLRLTESHAERIRAKLGLARDFPVSRFIFTINYHLQQIEYHE